MSKINTKGKKTKTKSMKQKLLKTYEAILGWSSDFIYRDL